MASTPTPGGDERGRRRPRKRYVGFSVESGSGPPLERSEMVRALDEACNAEGLEPRRRLTVFTGSEGIVRCDQVEIDAILSALRSIKVVGGRPATVAPVVTSGTIKKVKSHLRLGRDD